MFSLYSSIIFLFCTHCYCLSLNQIKEIFRYDDCLVGTLASLKNMKEDVMVPQETFPLNDQNNEKSVLSSINELSQYNDIKYYYEMINEEGPSHDKTFTITLYLGDESYSAAGKSMKIAQRNAAMTALKNTQYQHPPLKINEGNRLTPVAILYSLTSKLGLSVKFTEVDYLELGGNSDGKNSGSRRPYVQKLNDSLNDTIHIRKDGSDTKGPFRFKLDVNGQIFIGEAHTKKAAKHEAATQALKFLKNNKEFFDCLEKDGCKSQKQNNKSPISLVYEEAQKRNLAVEFELSGEEGLPHRKTFTTKCRVGNLEATGSGKSKKESKRAAAENIIAELLQIPEKENAAKAVNINPKSKRKNKKNKVIKTTFDKIDRIYDNVMEFGKGLLNTIHGNEQSDDKKPKKKKGEYQHSPSEELLLLGSALNVQIQYNDFEEGAKNFALLSLGTKPEFLCLGEGVTKKQSRDLAAKHGFNVLHKLGLLDTLTDKTGHISGIVNKEKEYQHIILDVVEETKDEL